MRLTIIKGSQIFNNTTIKMNKIKPITQIAFELLLYLYHLEQAEGFNIESFRLDFDTFPALSFDIEEGKHLWKEKSKLMLIANQRGDNLHRALDYLIEHGYIEPKAQSKSHFTVTYFGFKITAHGYDIVESITDEEGVAKIESQNHFHLHLAENFNLSFPINIDLGTAIKTILGLPLQ